MCLSCLAVEKSFVEIMNHIDGWRSKRQTHAVKDSFNVMFSLSASFRHCVYLFLRFQSGLITSSFIRKPIWRSAFCYSAFVIIYYFYRAKSPMDFKRVFGASTVFCSVFHWKWCSNFGEKVILFIITEYWWESCEWIMSNNKTK